MKSIYIVLFLFLVSCSPIKVKDFNYDYTQEIVGKIKSIDIKKYEYKFIKKDTVNLVKNTILNFDVNKKLKNEKFFTETEKKEISYKYVNGLIIQKEVISDNDTTIIDYKYDEANNLIEEKSSDKNGLYNITTQAFDKYHNPIEINKNFANKIKQTIQIEYNYKKNYFISKSFIDTLSYTKLESKKYFDKKGYIIKIHDIKSKTNANYFTFEIDKKGNLNTKKYYKSDGTIIETVTFKNDYDNRGNIIIRERFLNNKLVDKTIYEITYY